MAVIKCRPCTFIWHPLKNALCQCVACSVCNWSLVLKHKANNNQQPQTQVKFYNEVSGMVATFTQFLQNDVDVACVIVRLVSNINILKDQEQRNCQFDGFHRPFESSVRSWFLKYGAAVSSQQNVYWTRVWYMIKGIPTVIVIMLSRCLNKCSSNVFEIRHSVLV